MDTNKHAGSSFDDFLEEDCVLEEVSARAHKRLLALQFQDIMAVERLSKTAVAAKMHTSRSQLNRLLDPNNTSVTLESLEQLAHAVGRKLKVEFSA
ncbi:MAG: Fis family transcriptional regulator [Motiliproteus sp.]